MFRTLTVTSLAYALLLSPALALPDFTRTVGLPDPKSITLYHDNVDPNMYWAPPTTMEYATQPSGIPVFSLIHYGIKHQSISGGMGAVLTVSVRPVIDQKELPQEWEKIKKDNPNARISVISPDVAFMDLILGSVLFDGSASTQVKTTLYRDEYKKVSNDPSVPKTATDEPKPPQSNVVVEDLTGTVFANDNSTTVIKDPSVASTTAGAQVGAYQAFAVSLTPDAGAVFATNGGEEASNFGARYRYVVSGIRTRVKAEITVNWSHLYEHIHEEAGGGWFAFKGRHAVDLQTLKESGAVKLNIIEGGFENDDDEFEMLFNTLVKSQINGEGMFKPVLTPTPPPGAPSTEGSFFGWSFSGAWSYQRLSEQKDFTFTIDRQIIGKRVFQVGMAFQGMCAKYPQLFVAQGIQGTGCIDTTDIDGAAQRFKTIAADCDTRANTERKSLYEAIGSLPTPELQKIALADALTSVVKYRTDCIGGK